MATHSHSRAHQNVVSFQLGAKHSNITYKFFGCLLFFGCEMLMSCLQFFKKNNRLYFGACTLTHWHTLTQTVNYAFLVLLDLRLDCATHNPPDPTLVEGFCAIFSIELAPPDGAETKGNGKIGPFWQLSYSLIFPRAFFGITIRKPPLHCAQVHLNPQNRNFAAAFSYGFPTPTQC